MKPIEEKLGNLVSFTRGLTYSKNNEVEKEGVAVLRATNIDLFTSKLVLDEIKYIDSKINIKEEKFALPGDILICTASGSKSHLGKVALIEKDQGMVFGGFMAVLRCKSSCNPKFLHLILTSSRFKSYLNRISDGANINNLKFSQIENFKIFLPSLDAQQKIVDKLYTAFAEINKLNDLNKKALLQKQNLEENFFKDFFKSLEEEYGMMKLEEGIQLISGQHIMSKDYNSVGDGIGYLTGPADFGSVSPVVSKFTLKPKKTAMKNDILITLKGSGIGKVNLMDQDELAISRQLAAIRPVKFDPSYLFIFLKTKFNYFQKLGNGAAIPGLSRGDVQTLEVPKVPILKQQEVLEKLQKFQLLLSRYETCQNLKFKELKSLKSSILLKELQSDIL